MIPSSVTRRERDAASGGLLFLLFRRGDALENHFDLLLHVADEVFREIELLPADDCYAQCIVVHELVGEAKIILAGLITAVTQEPILPIVGLRDIAAVDRSLDKRHQ